MRSRGPVLALSLAAALALAVWGLTSRAPAPVVLGRTNVVVAIGCTFRADQTTPYGGPATTPFLAKLAAEGTRFDDTLANAPWTKAATTSIVTGQYALDLAVNAPGRTDDQRLPDEAVTLAERFHDAGYTTVGGTANPNNNAVFGFAQGFDHYVEGSGLWRDQEKKTAGAVIVDDVLAHLPADGPFYAQVLLVDAHFPYDAGDAVTAWLPLSPTPRVARYRAMLGRLDAAFERLWDGLVARGVADDTVFIVIGDHGEGLHLPEHHGISHGLFLYPSTLHVPWIARGPGVAAGHVVTGLSQQVDLAPTLAGLFGLPIEPDLPGRDLSDRLAGGDGAGDARAFADTWFRDANRAAVYTTDRACQREFGDPREPKPTEPPFPTACFDRVTDPDRLRPIVDDALMQELIDWRADHEALRAAFVSEHGEPLGDVGDATKGALKGLGYVE